MAERADSLWQLDYLFTIAGVSWLIHVGVTFLVYVALVDTGPWAHLWFASMAVFSLAMSALGWSFRPVKERAPHVAARFGVVHSILTVGVGLTWASGTFGASAAGSEILLFYTLCLGGTALGAVSSQHALLRSCFLSIWSSIPGLSLAHLLHSPGVQGWVSALLMLLFAVMLSVTALRLHRFLLENHSLTEQLSQKVAELTKVTGRLEDATQIALDAEAAKSRLLAQASHDLRQPVHAIGLLTESLRERVVDADGQRIMDRIESALSSLGRLFKSLLSISALDAGRIRAEITTIPLNHILNDVMQQNLAAASRNNVDMRYVETDVWVSTDPGLLQNVVQNLVSNAVKYAPGARVVFGCRRRGGLIDIEVHDAGPGIAADDIANVFQEFMRIDGVAKQADQGMGLGLAIVRRLAMLLSLDVSVRSDPGVGSVFTVRGLKAVAATGDEPSAPTPRNPSAIGTAEQLLEGLRVLVVDDDEDARQAMLALLERWKCVTDTSGHPPDTVASFDAVFMDHELADGQLGLDHLSRLKKVTDDAFLPVLVTGSSEPTLAGMAVAKGVVLVRKPMQPAQLRSLLLTAASAKAEIKQDRQATPSVTATAAAAARVGTSSNRNIDET
jgi:signal transduction histidine kinase/FixJ family two-component response regulator